MKNLSKEQVFERLKDLILTLARKGKEFKDNEALRQKWSDNRDVVNKAAKGLSSCDILWLSEQYEQWFNSSDELQDKIEDYHKQFCSWV